MNDKLTTVLFIFIIAISAPIAAAQETPDKIVHAAEQADSENTNFDISDGGEQSLLDRVTAPLSFMFSLATSTDTVEQSDDVTFTAEHSPNDIGVGKSYDNVRFVVGVYHCTPTDDCSDPNEFVESASKGFPVLSGTLESWLNLQKEITYTVSGSADTGEYEAVSYLWWAGQDGEFGTGDEQVVSDTSTNTFTVVSSDSTDDSTDDSSDDSTDDATSTPNVVSSKQPDVRFEDGSVVGTVYFENTGDAMQESHVVEMQVRDPGVSPLSFLDNHAKTCDPAHPENVHKEFKLDSGESASAELRTDAVTTGEEKVVYFMTRTACAQDRDGAGRVDPYPYSYNAGTICIGCGDDGGSGNGGIPFVAVIAGAALLIAGGVILRG